MITTLLVTFSIFAIVMAVMAVGVIFSGRCLRGSCGGPEVLDGDGEPISCAACPRRKQREAARSPGGST
jgi:hypothetical protein